MAFHAGTEQAMLVYLKNLVQVPLPQSEANEVLEHIDTFCLLRHWMMHVGSDKSAILHAAISTAVSNFLHPVSAPDPDVSPSQPFNLLELGTYCGYSAVKLAITLKELLGDRPFVIHSLEIDEKNAEVASEVIRLAGFEKEVNVIVSRNVEAGIASIRAIQSNGGGQGQESEGRESAALSSQTLQSPALSFHATFIDHDKDDYLSDLQYLLHQSLLPTAAVVIADNVVMGRIDDYRDFVREEVEREGGKFTDSKLHFSSIEYCTPDRDQYTDEELKDGVEVSVVR